MDAQMSRQSRGGGGAVAGNVGQVFGQVDLLASPTDGSSILVVAMG